jgi:SAM-dependent methyltransferase
MNKLTTQNYWVNVQGQPNIKLDNANIIKYWIESQLDFSSIRNCIEIGCFPGRYLSIFADHHVEVNGIDYIPEVSELKDLFLKNGNKVGQFWEGDFFELSINKKYDCVYSLGFIEHFKDWKLAIKKHCELVNENGYLIIETPNFRGFFQRIPRFLFDYKNYKRHNIESMNLYAWEKILKENGFEILNKEYIGGYLLWFENPPKNKLLIKFKDKIISALKLIVWMIFKDQKDHKLFSAAIGIIAIKRI